MGVLLFYTSAISVTKIRTIKSPSLQQYLVLYDKYSQTLTCPCKSVSINYNHIVYINYTLHQVCSSVFVSEEWINYLTDSWLDMTLNNADFRVSSASAFQALQSFCVLVDDIISNSLARFYSTQYSSISLSSLPSIRLQALTQFNEFRSSTSNDFSSSMQIIRDMTQANQLFSALESNAGLFIPSGTIMALPDELAYNNCSCGISPTCTTKSNIYNGLSTKILYTVPGMYVGCYIVEALRQSSLECFYNQTCFDQLISAMNYTLSSNITIMNASSPSRFLTTTTMGDLLDELMVEEWNWTTLYQDYFDTCDPIECSYTYQTRNDAIYIVTTMIGLLGGLVTAIRLMVPRIVMIIRRKPVLSAINMVRNHRFARQQPQDMVQTIRSLNLFPSIPPTMNQHQLKTQLISTRVFVVSLISALTILLLYTSILAVTKTNTVKSPSLHQYLVLFDQYPQTLTCPCTQVSIGYDHILHINYTLHQVCASAFVTDQWIDYVKQSGFGMELILGDFRMIIPFTFQALRSFCELVAKSIVNSLSHFYANQYLTINLLPLPLIQSKAQALFIEFYSSTKNGFSSSMRVIRDTTQTNSLFSTSFSNSYMAARTDSSFLITQFLKYGECSCQVSSACIVPAVFVNGRVNQVLFTVPGMYVGCYIVEALRQSSLECFYNQTCFDQLISAMNYTLSSNITIMNASSPSRFLTTTTMGDLLDELMVEEWNWTTLYQDYFDTCDPMECSYTYQTRNDAIYIVTTIIGLVGGLNTALRLSIPRAVLFIFYLRRKIRRKILNTVTPIQEYRNGVEKF